MNLLVASDTGPLISLEKLDHGYWLMRQLYTKLLVPPAVLQELMIGTDQTVNDYLDEYQIANFLYIIEPKKTFQYPDEFTLHKGEIQAIALAIEYQCPLLIEEHSGREVAKRLGIQFSGIAGQILQAYRQQLIDAEVATAEWLRLRLAGRIGRALHQSLLEVL